MPNVIFEEIEVDKLLEPIATHFWKYTNSTKRNLNYTILPDGYFDLVVKVIDNKLDTILLFGLCTKEIEVFIPSEGIVLGVCFKPLAAEYLFNKSIANILNTSETISNGYLNLDNIPFNDFKYWTIEVGRQMILELRIKNNIDHRKEKIFNLLFQSAQIKSVQELSNLVLWNPRQLNRYFKNSLGLSLKSYMNILRCYKTYSAIKNGELSPNNNFYDQSHFIKEIKKHTGVSPKELNKNDNDRFLQFTTKFKS